MKDKASQILSVVSLVLLPFIPNNIQRYIMLVFVPISFTAYHLHNNMPHRWVEKLDTSMEEIDTVFDTAMTECARDPHFLCETGLKLTETNYTLSTLRARTIGMKYISWKVYSLPVHHHRLAINDCRRDMEDLRSTILLALEHARQQVFQEDIAHRKTTLATAFPGALWQQSLTQRRSWTRIRSPSNEQLYLRQVMTRVYRPFFDTSTSSV
ncbi:hypothetical protein C8F04DRAFT_1238543 [Mycena alexandri]|uniref:Uncharacterized protein n=1 Tax=Mycena alexandri TaxID=1745969 RepID=A0AAD6SF55_9AGAR|nr:hypothetical protein C8F04DRAFT_1238543 [Mycena alexandri]